jgi:predicted DNA-binding transcriptional regulator AlpA
MTPTEARPAPVVNPPIEFVTPEDARRDHLAGASESTEDRLRKTDPTFPRRVELSAGRFFYIKAELEAWVASRIAARDRGEVPAAVLRGRELGKRAGGRPKKPDPRQMEMQVEQAE